MSEYVLTIPVELQEQFMLDIMTTAAEGGIDYWARYDVERNSDNDVIKITDIADAEDPDEFSLTCTPGHILNALQLAIEKPTMAGLRARIESEILDDGGKSCALDADDCDTLVQLGIFGTVIYG